MSDWRAIPMRDIAWVALLPTYGPCVYHLRKLSEPTTGPAPQYRQGCWADLTLGQVADLGRDDLLRHQGVGPGAIRVLESIMDLAAAGHSLTRPAAVRET